MANSWFQFKQFQINQEKASMKVGTDGVLLGAWCQVEGVEKALDIGTGTGLIALMLAQRNTNVIIDAVEIDKGASQQAVENISNSSWNERIHVYNKSIQEFENDKKSKYDLIVCNPPFFVNSMKANDASRTIARHNDTLSFNDLGKSVDKLLNSRGVFSVVMPFVESLVLIEQMQQLGYSMIRKVNVIPLPEKQPKRLLLEFKKGDFNCKEQNLIVEAYGRHQYSEEYIELTKEFYLFM